MIYGYIRVSTDKQTVENQRFEILQFCRENNLSIDAWIEETISGTKEPSKRKLGVLLDRVQKDDLIICSELSRLGRNLFMIMSVLNEMMLREARIWTIKDNYRLGDDIQSKVLAFAFGLSAEIERNLISQRTREALARKKAEGVKLGRRKETEPKYYKIRGHEEEIKLQLKMHIPKTKIADSLGITPATLYRYMKIADIPLDAALPTTDMPDGSTHPHGPETHPD